MLVQVVRDLSFLAPICVYRTLGVTRWGHSQATE